MIDVTRPVKLRIPVRGILSASRYYDNGRNTKLEVRDPEHLRRGFEHYTATDGRIAIEYTTRLRRAVECARTV
jgi:hypothetical protein